MAVAPVAPTAKTVPSGRKTCGPISCDPLLLAFVSANLTMVLPALIQPPVPARYLSELVRFVGLLASTVRTDPSANSVHPSSSLMSALLAPVVVQVMAARSRMACCLVQQFASMYLPLGKTMLWASPIVVQPLGGATDAQVFVSGS